MSENDHREDDELELFREPDDGPGDEPGPARPRVPTNPPPGFRPRPHQRMVVVSGAKGGVGKTILASNLALYLATIGRRVLLVDAAPEGGNVHTCLGAQRPGAGARPPLVDPYGPPAEGDPEDAESHIVDTSVPGLRLLHAGIDEPVRGATRRTTRARLHQQLAAIDAEYFVVDLGSGTSPAHLDFFLRADVALFVATPEPPAIDNTYRFVRAAFARYLRGLAPDRETRRRIVERLRAMGNTPAPHDLARRLEAAGDPLADLVRSAMDDFHFRFVLNQTRLRADLELGEAMRSAVRRRFGIDVDYLGYIDYDDTVWSCVRMRRPLLVESPGTKSAKSIEKIARRLLASETGNAPRSQVRTVPPESHHDLLEVERGATDEEIRRAYKRVKDIYALDALCCYGLFDEAAMDSLRARLEEAYDVLLDPARRRPYELSVFPPDPEPVAVPSPDADEEPKPPPPVITPDTEFTGALLRAVRESQGVDLNDISQRTKVGRAYLKAIEEDDFGALPAPVYVRGFVTEIAKFLRLDAAQVGRTYIRRLKRHLEEREKSL